MANETTITSITELVPAETIGKVVMEYAHDFMPIAGLCREVQLPPNSGKVFSFPRWVKDAHEDITTEGTTALTNTELETTETSITVAQIGLGREVTKMAQRTNILGGVLLQQMMMDAATTLALAVEDDLAALFTSITDSVGTTTLDLTIANMLSAIAAQRVNLVQGQLEFVLAQIQLEDLNAAIAASGASLWSAGANQSTVNATMSGYAGKFLDANVWVSSLCDTANAGADRVGACINNGRISPTRPSLGLVNFWFAEMDTDKDIYLLTDRFAWSACYGVGLIGDAYSVKIVTGA